MQATGRTASAPSSIQALLDGESPGLSVRELCFARRGAAILDRVSFDLAHGGLLAVVGPSGAGKSTLLSLLAGFESPASGEVCFGGVRWNELPPSERSVGMSFDDASLHEHLTVRENLDAAAMPRGEPAQRRRDRVSSLLQSLGIAHLQDRRPAAISAGERRRVAVGRAFIRAPRLALLDEPFANLDRGNRFTIRQLVRELQRSTGTTTVIVTHDPTDALAIADDLLVLVRGEARARGNAVSIAANPPDLEVAQLVDDLGMHVVEIAADGACADATLAQPFLERIARLRADRGVHGPTLVGIRPWHLRVGEPQEPSIVLDAMLLAHEPAGVFTDLIAQRSDGRVLRARVPASDAQDLPIRARIRLHVHERDAHLFASPWPGTRLDEAAAPSL